MKILLDAHMLDKKETGNERCLKNIALALKKYYPQTKIFLYGNKVLAKNKEFLKKFDGVFVPFNDNGLYRIFIGFNQAIKKFKPDILFSQNFIFFKKNIKTVLLVLDLCFKSYPHFFSLKSNLAFRYFFKRSLNLADKIICISKSTKKNLLRYYPLNSKKIAVVYQAADPVFYFIKDKKKVKKYLKNKFGIKNDYFLVVGNIEKRKQPEKIINVFKKILKKVDVSLVFVGKNKLKIKEKESIKILNYMSDFDLNFLYNGALALIYFSLCEGFGLPIVEAIKTKTPVIIKNLPVFKEIVGNYSFFANNEKELEKKMLILAKDKDLRKKCLRSIFKKEKDFSWKKTAEKIYQLFLSLTKSTKN